MGRRRREWLTAWTAGLIALAGCSGDGDGSGTSTAPETTTRPPTDTAEFGTTDPPASETTTTAPTATRRDATSSPTPTDSASTTDSDRPVCGDGEDGGNAPQIIGCRVSDRSERY